MRRLPLPTGAEGAGAAALVIRLVVGPVMAYHGYRKVDGGVSSFVETVRMLDVPFPKLTAYAVVVIELVGGLCILVGLLTRLWTLLLAAQMVAITFVVKSDAGLIGAPGQGPGFELDLVIAACAVALVLIGPGILALDRLLRLERAPAVAARART